MSTNTERRHSPNYQQWREREWQKQGITLNGQPVTWADYQQIRASQQHRCAIQSCAERLDAGAPLDHDHKTGEVRGVLCDRHNKMLAEWLEVELPYLALYLLRGR